MPNWGAVLGEIQGMVENPLDTIRHKYLATMNKYTNRNIIAYYSAFLQRSHSDVAIDDNDKNALMQTVYGLDKSKGLDIILHTPGGNITATESIVNYLKSLFGRDIRAFVPQIAMSAGTMIALSCKEIIMGKQSNIGPVDPQYGGISCGGVIEEFKKACNGIKEDPSCTPLWQTIISKYHPTFLGDCEKAIELSEKIVKDWLCDNMFYGMKDAEEKAQKIIDVLGSHQKTFSHSKHIHFEECKELGINVIPLESFEPKEIDGCKDLQDCVLTIHHSYMHTFSKSNAVKIVENHIGNAMIITTNTN